MAVERTGGFRVDTSRLARADEAAPAARAPAEGTAPPAAPGAPATPRAPSGSFTIAAMRDRIERAAEAAPAFDPDAMSTQRTGSRGAEVQTLQTALNAWRAERGLPAIQVDGKFGPQTRGAVEAFQRATGMAVDGVAGPATWSALAGRAPASAAAGAPASPGPAAPAAPPSPPSPGAPAAPGAPGAPPSAAGPTTTVPAGGSTFPQTAETRRLEGAWRSAGLTGNLSISNLPSNGGRPAAVYVPANLDPSKPVRVITYFHGHGGNVGDSLGRQGQFERLKALERANPNTVFVLPQAGSKPFSYWMKPPRESGAALEREALGEAARLAGAPSLEIGERVLSAHSGGGLALKNLVQAGEARADRIEFLDATYGDWGHVVARWAAAQPEGRRPRIDSWTTPGDTRNHDREIARIAPGVFHAHDSPVGHSAVPGRFLGASIGQP